MGKLDESLEEGEYSQEDYIKEDSGKEIGLCEQTNKLIEEKIDSSIDKVKNYFEGKFNDLTKVMELEKQLAENKKHLEQLKAKGKAMEDDDTFSELTVYKNAVEKDNKRGSSSSEDGLINTSDEVDQEKISQVSIDHFSERELWGRQTVVAEKSDKMTECKRDDVQPSTSAAARPERKDGNNVNNQAVERANKVVKDAKAAKVRVYEVSGMIDNKLNKLRAECGAMVGIRLSVDDDYLLVASHVDETIKQKIVNHEYVDFSKLLRWDRTNYGDDEDGQGQRMLMVNKGGMSYWILAFDKSSSINSFTRWDQAFRIFLDVYTSRFPERTSELIQYGHIIQTASYSFIWENVYLYDREFQRHME